MLMIRLLKYSLLSILLIAAMGFMADDKKIKVYLIGDSTIAVKEEKTYPETGWGMPFVYFFDKTVEVDNRAKNGRSSKSFIAENRWQPVVDELKAGDYVFIQFGHNDESKDKKERYSTPEEFKANLTRYIRETKDKQGIPVLLTPVSRRKFDAAGKAQETHKEYSQLVRDVAKETGVALIDLDARSTELLQQYGDEPSKQLFNQLAPGEHPNYPQGVTDNTHFNELGARKMAQLVLKDIVALKLGLAAHIVQPQPKKTDKK
jgi:lysophospholipase L1-like esterase